MISDDDDFCVPKPQKEMKLRFGQDKNTKRLSPGRRDLRISLAQKASNPNTPKLSFKLGNKSPTQSNDVKATKKYNYLKDVEICEEDKLPLELYDKISRLNEANFTESINWITENFRDKMDLVYYPIVYFATINPQKSHIYCDAFAVVAQLFGNIPTLSFVINQSQLFAGLLVKTGLYEYTDLIKVSQKPIAKILLSEFEEIESISQFFSTDKPLNFLKNGYSEESIQGILINDNAEELKKKIVNFKQKIEVSPLCPIRLGTTVSTMQLEPLSFAAYYGSINCVKYILSEGTQISKEACNLAVAGGNVEVVKLFLDGGGNFSDSLAAATVNHRHEIFDLVVEKSNVFVAQSAADCGNIRVLLYCYGNNPSLLTDRLVTQQGAVKNGHFPIIDLIGRMTAAEDEERSIDIALKYAVSFENRALTNYLVRAGANLSGCGCGLILDALETQNITKIEFILSVGMDINVKDGLWMRPLHHAVEFDSPEIVEFLVAHGADINATSMVNGAMTPLHFAVQLGNEPMVRLLLSLGADVDAHFGGVSPLQLACERSTPEVVVALLENGANVNMRHAQTRAPPLLTLALSSRPPEECIEIARLLRSKGAPALTPQYMEALGIPLPSEVEGDRELCKAVGARFIDHGKK